MYTVAATHHLTGSAGALSKSPHFQGGRVGSEGVTIQACILQWLLHPFFHKSSESYFHASDWDDTFINNSVIISCSYDDKWQKPPQNRVLLVKKTAAQLIKKCPSFYET